MRGRGGGGGRERSERSARTVCRDEVEEGEGVVNVAEASVNDFNLDGMCTVFDGPGAVRGRWSKGGRVDGARGANEGATAEMGSAAKGAILGGVDGIGSSQISMLPQTLEEDSPFASE